MTTSNFQTIAMRELIRSLSIIQHACNELNANERIIMTHALSCAHVVVDACVEFDNAHIDATCYQRYCDTCYFTSIQYVALRAHVTRVYNALRRMTTALNTLRVALRNCDNAIVKLHMSYVSTCEQIVRHDINNLRLNVFNDKRNVNEIDFSHSLLINTNE